MKSFMKKSTALVLTAVLTVLMLFSVSAVQTSPFDDEAYYSVVTGSDFQDTGTKAYDRFENVLSLMKDDGLETPHSLLVGGDYTKILFDYAVPGISLIKDRFTAVYPDADPDSVVCIQGNHDNTVSGFTKTGFYDMGAYCLYAINENDFPWKQNIRPDSTVKKTAADLDEWLTYMISSGDMRPVIVMTHVPLHHTTRSGGGDNKYSSYIFSVLNKAAEKLDIIFIFGHNHSKAYDDYIGGSVNFMEPGDTIRIPRTDKTGDDCYTEETLNFTYTNCGYIGYSNNSVSDTSTNVLSLGVIRFGENGIRFVKYTEDGVFTVNEVARKNTASEAEKQAVGVAGTALFDTNMWMFERDLFMRFFELLQRIIRILSCAG